MNKTVATLSMLIGLILIVAGVGLFIMGASSRAEVIRGMAEEEVTTELDGEQVSVTTARAAMAQYNLIKEHTLGSFGSYSSMERDDPRRDTYLKGLTLRNSLVIGRMGLQISLLIMGLGVLFLLTGIPLTMAGAGGGKSSS